MRPDYAAHDRKCQQLRTEGKLGWTDAQEVRAIIADLETVLGTDDAPRGGRALELGCGAGELTLWLATRGFEAHGVDIAPTAIAWAQEKAAQRNLHAEFRVGNVVELPGYLDDSFDFVLDGLCLHCIIGEDRGRALASVRRVLRPGGLFHLRTMCGDPAPGSSFAEQFDPHSRCLVVNGIATRYLGLPGRIIDEIRTAGLQVLRWRVLPRKGDQDLDDLLLDAVKPAYRPPPAG